MLARNKRIFNLNVKRLYINMHVCVYIYIYIYIHTHTHTHTLVFIHTYIYQFSHSVVSNSFRPHGLQHTRLPCASTTPGACSCPWVGDDIQSSHPLSPSSPPVLPSIFPSIRVFSNESVLYIRWPVRTEISASALVLPMNFQDWFP